MKIEAELTSALKVSVNVWNYNYITIQNDTTCVNIHVANWETVKAGVDKLIKLANEDVIIPFTKEG